MEDIEQQPTSEPLTVEQVTVVPEPTVNPKQSENLIQNNKRLSLFAQIFNWQPTPISIRISLPIETRWNRPLFAIEVTPFWIPLSWFMSTTTTWGGTRVLAWEEAKAWHYPAPTTGDYSLNTYNTPGSVNMVEKDNMPDISWQALNHVGWSGEIDYMFRCISNVTTQGKLSFSRVYNVERPSVYFNANDKCSLFNLPLNSQSTRKKNSFMILDLSRTTDLQVNCPYVDTRPIKKTYNRTSHPLVNGALETNSYIIVDIIDLLSASAGSAELIIDLWIKAGPDFQFHQPIPPRYDDLLTCSTTWPTLFCDRAANFAPSIFGNSGSNVVFTGVNVATIPTDAPT